MSGKKIKLDLGFTKPKADEPVESGEGRAESQASQTKKRALNIMVYPSTLEKARDAAYWAPGWTISNIFEVGALELIERLEQERGGEFPPRAGDVKTGRPPK